MPLSLPHPTAVMEVLFHEGLLGAATQFWVNSKYLKPFVSNKEKYHVSSSRARHCVTCSSFPKWNDLQIRTTTKGRHGQFRTSRKPENWNQSHSLRKTPRLLLKLARMMGCVSYVRELFWEGFMAMCLLKNISIWCRCTYLNYFDYFWPTPPCYSPSSLTYLLLSLSLLLFLLLFLLSLHIYGNDNYIHCIF